MWPIRNPLGALALDARTPKVQQGQGISGAAGLRAGEKFGRVMRGGRPVTVRQARALVQRRGLGSFGEDVAQSRDTSSRRYRVRELSVGTGLLPAIFDGIKIEKALRLGRKTPRSSAGEFFHNVAR